MVKILSEAHEELAIRNQHAAPEKSNVSRRETAAIFVVHGRNEKLRQAMFQFLQSLGLNPLEWSAIVAETKSGAPFIGAVLDAGMSKAQAVVVMFTPDDEARLRSEFVSAREAAPREAAHEKELTAQPRPNVLFEAGLAFGRHPESTILVQVGEMRPFSDIAGRHLIRMDNTPQRRLEFANRLKAVGCKIDLRGEQWITSGDFTVAGQPA
jgi:predicted nucleotide-binding protein